jgi:serine/threonine protein kinase
MGTLGRDVSHSLVLSPGQRVGPYTVVSPLRAGGMATLYLARRIGPAGFARQVALKVVHAHLSRDPQFVRMFVDEALLCARIRHPNVVHVEELGEYEGAYYLAMEYVEGASLEDLFDRLCALGERLPPRLSVSIACSLLEGLHATHTLVGDAGEPLHVVHRDVSPSNTLIDRAGHVKLIDFGVAKARGRAVETSAGTLKGKYAYMSPEQAFGRELDHRSDIYSLAIMLWEMLTMRPLFVADTDLALLDIVRAPALPSLSELVPDVPPAIEQVLRRALAVDREERPATARQLRQMLLAAYPEARTADPAELGSLLEHAFGPLTHGDAPGIARQLELGSTVASTPAHSEPPARLSPPAGTQAGEPRKRRRGALLLASLGLLLLVTALGLWTRERAESTRAQAAPPAPPESVGTRDQAAKAPAAQVVPSLAAPPQADPLQVEAVVEPEPPSTPKVSTRERASRRKQRSEAARTAEPRDEVAPANEEPPAQRTKEMHGVPIVEKPAF